MSLDAYSLHIIVHVYFFAAKTNKESYKCASKQHEWPKTQFCFFLLLTSQWFRVGHNFCISHNFLKTMKLQIMKKMSKQNTKKGSVAQNRTERTLRMFMLYVLCVVLVRVYFDLLLLHFFRLNNRIVSLNSVNDSRCTNLYLTLLFTQQNFQFRLDYSIRIKLNENKRKFYKTMRKKKSEISVDSLI